MARAMTAGEVLGLPALVPFADAHRAFGIGASAAKELHAAGRYPVAVVKVGRLLKVRRTDLLAFLGLTAADHLSEAPALTSAGEAPAHTLLTLPDATLRQTGTRRAS